MSPSSSGELTTALAFAHCWFANTELAPHIAEALTALGEATITSANAETNELTIRSNHPLPSFELPVGFAAWVQSVISELATLPPPVQRVRFEFGRRKRFRVRIEFEGARAVARVGVVVDSKAEIRKAA